LTGPDDALAELGRAVAHAAQALKVMPRDDDLAAYRYVTGLDEALRSLAGLLRAASGIVEFADAPTVSSRLAAYRAELGVQRGRVETARGELDSLREVEKGVTQEAAEAERLRRRVDDIETAQRMAAELPRLRTRLRELEGALADAAQVADATDVAAKLGQAAERLGMLSARQLDVLGERTRELIAQAQAASRELGEQRARRDAAAADLAERGEQARQLQDALDQLLPSLIAWRQADADLADGLRRAGLDVDTSPLETVRAELADLGQRMSALDDQLRLVLAKHAQAYDEARRIRNLSGGGS
jgi:hypothetical protein